LQTTHTRPSGEASGSPAALAGSVEENRRFESTFGARILLADDNADMRNCVGELLAPYYDVEPVADGQAALEAAERERPDLVLCDAMMPRLDGCGFVAKLRAAPGLIVKQLVELHNGDVSAASDGLGKGATFTVRLPMYWADVRSPLGPRLPTREVVHSLDGESLDGVRVLVVEDQPDMLEYLKRVLEERGAEVITAGSGREAVEHLESPDAQPLVLVSDIGMPEMSGYQLLRTLRQERGFSAERLPAIAVTAFTRDEDRERALDAGFQGYLTKPYELGNLIALVRQLGTTRPRLS
jgi:CheY-like chemotaxis protein